MRNLKNKYDKRRKGKSKREVRNYHIDRQGYPREWETMTTTEKHRFLKRIPGYWDNKCQDIRIYPNRYYYYYYRPTDPKKPNVIPYGFFNKKEAKFTVMNQVRLDFIKIHLIKGSEALKRRWTFGMRTVPYKKGKYMILRRWFYPEFMASSCGFGSKGNTKKKRRFRRNIFMILNQPGVPMKKRIEKYLNKYYSYCYGSRPYYIYRKAFKEILDSRLQEIQTPKNFNLADYIKTRRSSKNYKPGHPNISQTSGRSKTQKSIKSS